MHHITPHLWFDKEAKQAADFYTTVFPNTKVTHHSEIKDTPSGDTEIMSFDLNGQPFMAISAGPIFKINPSISFFVNYDPSQDDKAKEHLDEAWKKLSDGGSVMMPLQEYPFSKHYGWIQDKFGVSWQLMLTNPNGDPRPFIIPSLMFTGEGTGKAEDAIHYYVSVFKDGKVGSINHYPEGAAPEKDAELMFGDFKIMDTWMAAMDSGRAHDFGFNEAVSLVVTCENQEEIDYYWEKLSAVPESEQCGWCKDKFGVSWQIVPIAMNKMMSEGTPEQIGRVTQCFLKMKKFDIAELEEAYKG